MPDIPAIYPELNGRPEHSHRRGSGLFYYTVLCNYANFRTSYLRIYGIGYTVYPGEWICTVLDYNCPCQKDTSFFFMPTVVATELASAGRLQ